MQNSSARSAIDVGATIDGTYTIEAVLGRGGMGEVFLATHNRLAGKKVAIKTLHAELSSDEVFARFKREADIASRLDHPNIVKVLDYKQLPDGTPYIVYEYLQGESLADRLAKIGALPVAEVLTILRQVGSALAAAHRAGIVHRDLKPQNIFLSPSEVDGHATEVAKVLDFGISKIHGSQTVKTMESSLLGTPQYMAPEQANSQHALVDEKTDIFALGVIAYEMLSGKAAFSGASIPEVVFRVVYEQPTPLLTLVPSLPQPVVAAIEKAMAKSGADRYPTVPQFIEALTGVPLSVMRRPTGAVPPNQLASSERANSQENAFANTWHSGLSSKPTMPGSSPGQEAAVSATPGPSEKPARSSRRWITLVGIVLLSGIGFASVTYVVTRQPAIPASPTEHPSVAKTDGSQTPAPVVTAAPADAMEPDAAVVLPDASTVADAESSAVGTDSDSTKRDRPNAKAIDKANRKVAKKPPAEDTIADDEKAAQKLEATEAALRDKAYSRAEQLANSVIMSEAASRLQKAYAYTLRGVVDCVVHNSEERARIALRQLANFPRLRRRLIAACRAEGHLRTE